MKENKKPDITVIIVNYQSVQYLDRCLSKLLRALNGILHEIILINNDTGEQKDIHHLLKQYPNIHTIHHDNTGFAKANNEGIRIARGDYILTLNVDVFLEKEYVSLLLKRMHRDTRIGGMTGKLLGYDFIKKQKLTSIDTTGLYMKKNRQVYDRGQHEKDRGQYNEYEEVFGVSAAAALYRKKALDDVKVMLPPSHKASADSQLLYSKGRSPYSAEASRDALFHNTNGRAEYFDEDFFSYKEDVDLSWRLQRYGWKCMYEPKAYAYHVRGTGSAVHAKNPILFIKHRKKIPRKVRYLSFRNQHLMQIKNETIRYAFKHLFSLLLKEVGLFFYALMFEPFLLKSYFEFKTLKKMLKKR